jgi:ATP-dependent helicase/nuclease subunit A
MSPRSLPPDQVHRDRAVAARGVNVLVDAGAGTGKTTLLVRRLVEMVAPLDDGQEALLLSRIAAVTFTRKAAGELRLRVRERLLAELAGGCSARRRERLARALAESDTAFIGTIHGFADRLLRMKPVEARLSPSYEIVEDADALCREAFELLLQAAEAGRLAEELAGTACDASRAAEAADAIRTAVAAGVRVESQELEWITRHGLDSLFAGFILHRDVPPPEARPAPFLLARVQEKVRELRALAASSRGDGAGSRWMAGAAGRLRRIEGFSDPVELYREVGLFARLAPADDAFRMKRDFPGDKAGWEAWRAWRGGKEGPGYRVLVAGPLHRWMATRLVRAFPAVVAMYEKVKARHRAVDQVDLLLRLRDLLRDQPAARAELQALFDHVFMDEFQDTDPLQAEIVLFLCEDGAQAREWDEVALGAGKLTLVGDPKQSIYRFRRADISVYQAVRAIVVRGPHLLVPLTANFRSEPALIDHLNARFDEILGAPAAGKPDFDAAAGTVANQRLDKGRKGTRQACVAVLPYSTDEAKADSDRVREAEMLATWVRAAVEGGRQQVADVVTGEQRPLRYGDIALLAHATSHVGLLIDALDRLGVPWSARGGKLFLEDPLHRQFLLALRAVADRDDGVARAALLRAPFFALDLSDIVRARAAEERESDEGIDRARAAASYLQELRRRRFERPPGETARDLLDRTGLARAVALGPNGLQRLDRLRELCFELERLAAAEGLDYDGATARLRAWAVDPVALDPPRPVGTDAAQIMTIHQAKGLEFPAVVWWDARAPLTPRGLSSQWFVERTGAAWAMSLDHLDCHQPEASDVLARETAFEAAERRRLVYVAATRARDLLVLPVTSSGKGDFATTALRGADSPALAVEDPWTDDGPPAWARGVVPPPERQARVNEPLAAEVEAAWSAAAAEAAKPRFVPRGVAAEAHRVVEREGEGEAGARWKAREGRFGRTFGQTVHLAIGVALREPDLAPAEAVARAAAETGLEEHRAQAAEDVARSLAALEREGIRRAPGSDLRLEYPVAAAREGALLSGYIDLLAERNGELLVLDFKTDAPPSGDAEASHPAYVEQARSYGRLLVELGLAREGKVRCGLLFTGDGGLRWV